MLFLKKKHDLKIMVIQQFESELTNHGLFNIPAFASAVYVLHALA